MVKSDVGMDADVTGAKIAGWIFRADFLKKTCGLKNRQHHFRDLPCRISEKTYVYR